MDAQALVASLNEFAGLDLELGGDLSTVFDYQGRPVLLRFLPDVGQCLLCAELAVVEGAALPGALSTLLEANHLLSDTRGGCLSWTPDDQVASINFLLPVGDSTDAPALAAMLNRALSAADEWTQRILDMNSSAQEEIRKRMDGVESPEASELEMAAAQALEA
ncbi:MAG: type III secretion system chaperone [Succinivibrionaceae bacterium]|nr:type III secretion system chaperone [Succinivibrionaceae bacterium]